MVSAKGDAADNNAALAAAIATLTTELTSLRRFGKRTRNIIRVLTVSLLFDLGLTFGLAVSLRHANSAVHVAQQASSANVVACRSGNSVRVLEKQLWEYVLSLPPSQPVTPQQQVNIENFKAFIGRTFAPRQC